MLKTLRNSSALEWTAAALLLSIAIGLTVSLAVEAARRQGITMDEPQYHWIATQVARDGDFSGFARAGIGPLPILINHVSAALAQGVPARELEEQSVSQACEEEGRSRIFLARILTAVLFGVPLLVAIFLVLGLRHGPWVGLGAASVLGLSPSLLAHLSVATTDACVALFAFLSVVAMAWHLRSASRASLVSLSVVLGLAMASKYSAVFLIPIALVVVALSAAVSEGQRLGSISVLKLVAYRAASMGVCIFLVCWSVSGFALATPLQGWADTTPGILQGMKLPSTIVGLLSQLHHANDGHPAFLMGDRSSEGWWTYYPIVFAIKSTPVELLLTLPIVIQVIRTGRRIRRSTRPWTLEDRELLLWLSAVVVYVAFAISSSINIGHRYLLLLYPLLIWLGMESWCRLAPGRALRLAVVLGIVLLQATSALGVRPAYLQYFNFIVGGPQQGHHYVVDSNVDWGQDLPALEESLKELGGGKVWLAYFGRDCVDDYDIDAVRPTQGSVTFAKLDFVAISATHLQGAYTGEVFREFRSLVPLATANHSIFIYDYSDDRVRTATSTALTRAAQNRRRK